MSAALAAPLGVRQREARKGTPACPTPSRSAHVQRPLWASKYDQDTAYPSPSTPSPNESTTTTFEDHGTVARTIRLVAKVCGYALPSLRERLYVTADADGEPQTGVFIFTADGDAYGTLGGRVRTGGARQTQGDTRVFVAFHDSGALICHR